MEHLSVTVEKETLETVDRLKEEQDSSRSQVVRELLQEGISQSELREEIDTLRDRLETREERIEELERQLSKRSHVEEKVDTLAKQQQEPNAPFFVKWYRWYRDR